MSKFTDAQFIQFVKESLSYAEVLRKMGLKEAGGNYSTIKNRIKKLNLNTDHMTGAAWNQGDRYKPVKEAQDLKEILVQNSHYTNISKLRQRILKEGLKEHKCEYCNNTEWLGNPIALELHHINGIKNDLRIENLQMLCPNCHAYTDNYRGKGIQPKKNGPVAK